MARWRHFLVLFEYMKKLVIGKSSQGDPSGLLCFNMQNNPQDLKSSKLLSVMCPLPSGDDCGIQAVPESWLRDFPSCVCCWTAGEATLTPSRPDEPSALRSGLFLSGSYSLEGREGVRVRWQGNRPSWKPGRMHSQQDLLLLPGGAQGK